jgi:hypothetical protein
MTIVVVDKKCTWSPKASWTACIQWMWKSGGGTALPSSDGGKRNLMVFLERARSFFSRRSGYGIIVRWRVIEMRVTGGNGEMGTKPFVVVRMCCYTTYPKFTKQETRWVLSKLLCEFSEAKESALYGSDKVSLFWRQRPRHSTDVVSRSTYCHTALQ